MTDIEYQRMNLPRRFWTATWNNLNVSLQEMVKKYVSEAFASKAGKGLLLYGEEGRGKTYISAVIAKILREKEFQIYYLSASDISGQGIRKAFDDNSIMDRALAVDLLIIDDLNHATDKNVVYAILKYRSDNMLSTIISMRIKTKDLPVVTTKGKKKYSFPEYFERFYGELSPLVQGNILPIFINGENYRDKELNEYEKNMSI